VGRRGGFSQDLLSRQPYFKALKNLNNASRETQAFLKQSYL
jgi:hypothetical protein